MSCLDSMDKLTLDLACVASAAGFVHGPLLRHLRYEFVQEADAGHEAAVWWSDAVESRGVNGFTFRGDALDELRARLAKHEKLDKILQEIAKFHESGPALLVLEEQLVALALTEHDPEDLDKRLAAAVMALDGPRRHEVLSWAERSLHRLPRDVRGTTSAMVLALAAEQGTGLRGTFDGGGDASALDWSRIARWIPTSRDVEIELVARDGLLLATDTGRARRSRTLEEIPSAVARLRANKVEATAFLVAPTLSMTTAHAAAGDELRLDFDTGLAVSARVLHRSSLDYAILEHASVPIRPVEMSDSLPLQAVRWSAIGYVAPSREARLFAGQVHVAAQPLQLSCDMSGPFHGLSGAPVIVDGRVIGMIQATREHLVLATSTADILAAWPTDIEKPRVAPDPTAAVMHVPDTTPRVVMATDVGGRARTITVSRAATAVVGAMAEIALVGNVRGDVWPVSFGEAPPGKQRVTFASQDGFSARALVGDRTVLLAFDVAERARRDRLAGFGIVREGPSGTVRLQPKGLGDEEGELVQRMWWFDRPPPGRYRYTITENVSGQVLSPALSLDVEMPTPRRSVDVGFTSGRIIRNREPEQALPETGGTAYAMVCAFLDECIADPATTVDAFTYDLDHPKILRRFERLGKRLRILLDDSRAHAERNRTLAPSLRIAGCDVAQFHYRRLAHSKVLIRNVSGRPQSVLTGSANFSLHSLHDQHQFVIRLNEPEVATSYRKAFDDAFAGNHSRYPRWPSAGTNGSIELICSPTNALIDRVVEAINRATSSIIFCLSRTQAQRITLALEAARKRSVAVYGLMYGQRAVELMWGDERHVYEPAPEVNPGRDARFLAIDFSRPGALAIAGSSAYTNNSEEMSGENTLFIRDAAIATKFAVEALRVSTRYAFRGSLARGGSAVGKPTAGGWANAFYEQKDPRSALRRLLIDLPEPSSQPTGRKPKPTKLKRSSKRIARKK